MSAFKSPTAQSRRRKTAGVPAGRSFCSTVPHVSQEPQRSENQGKKEEEEVGGVGEEDLGDDFFILLLAEHLNPFKISHFFTVAA